MKETIKSLKAYFIFVAVLSLISSLATLGLSQINPLFLVIGLIGLAFSIAYLYVGITLRKLLVESPQLIINLLFVSTAYQVIIFLLSLLGGLRTDSIIQLVISLLILGYLFVNIKRLSQEAKSKIESE